MFYRVDYRIIERVEEVLCIPCKSDINSRANASPIGYVFSAEPIYAADSEGVECARCKRSKGEQGVLPVEAAVRKFGLMR